MLKSMPLFYSSPPKPAKETESKKAAKPSTSSESEADSVSIESSSEEAHPKDNMKTENHRQTPSLEHFPQPPLEVSGTDHVKEKHKKGLREKIVLYLFDRSGKSKEKEPQKENCQLVTAEQIKKLIKEQKFYEASQHLLIMQTESNSNLDNRRGEETLGNQTEIEALFEVLKQEVLSIIYSSITIASTQPELLNNAVRAVIKQVEEEERSVHSQPRKWKEEWRNTIQKSVEERMKEPPLFDNKDLSTTANSFLHMGKTMKEDMITVVQHIKHHYREHFQVCGTYAKFYHHCFSSYLEKFAQFELSNQDIYLLLTWVQNFYPKEIKNHSVLVKELEEASLGSLLPLRQIKQLELTYLTHEVAQCQHLVSKIDARALLLMSVLLPLTSSQQDHIRKPRPIAENGSVKRWLVKCLDLEVNRWMQGNEPEKLEGFFHSELSIDAIQTIYGAQKRAENITLELGNQMSVLLLTEFLTFLQRYREELKTFIKGNKHNQYFEAIIIANINNCVSFRTHAEENTDSAESDVKTQIFSALNDLQNIGFNVFLPRLLEELQPLFKMFTEKKWVFCTDIMDEIIKVTEAHICLFKMLKKSLRQAVMEKIHLLLVKAYISRLLKKKVSFRSPEQQNQLSAAIQRNASNLYSFCTENGSNATWLRSVLPSLSEIIRLQDPNAIMVEVSALASRYPDISKKHLSAILYIKGNLSSAELRSILSVLNIRGNATLPPPSSPFLGIVVT